MKIKTRKIFISVCSVMLVFVSVLMLLHTSINAQAAGTVVVIDNILTITGEKDKPIWQSKDVNNTNLTITEDLENNSVTIGMKIAESKKANERFTYNAVMSGYGEGAGNALYGVKADDSTIGFKLDDTDLHTWSEYFISFGSYVEGGVSLVGVAINRADGKSTKARYVLGVDGAPAGNWLIESELIQLTTFHWGLTGSENLLTTKVVDGFPQFAINGQDITLSGADFIKVAKERYAALSKGVGFVTIGAKYDDVDGITTPTPSKFTTTITKITNDNTQEIKYSLMDIDEWHRAGDLQWGTKVEKIDSASQRDSGDIKISTAEAGQAGASRYGVGATNKYDYAYDTNGFIVKFKANYPGDEGNTKFTMFWSSIPQWYSSQTAKSAAFGLQFIKTGGGATASIRVRTKSLKIQDFQDSDVQDGVPFNWADTAKNTIKFNVENGVFKILINGTAVDSAKCNLENVQYNILPNFNQGKAFFGLWSHDEKANITITDIGNILQTYDENFVLPNYSLVDGVKNFTSSYASDCSEYFRVKNGFNSFKIKSDKEFFTAKNNFDIRLNADMATDDKFILQLIDASNKKVSLEFIKNDESTAKLKIVYGSENTVALEKAVDFYYGSEQAVYNSVGIIKYSFTHQFVVNGERIEIPKELNTYLDSFASKKFTPIYEVNSANASLNIYNCTSDEFLGSNELGGWLQGGDYSSSTKMKQDGEKTLIYSNNDNGKFSAVYDSKQINIFRSTIDFYVEKESTNENTFKLILTNSSDATIKNGDTAISFEFTHNKTSNNTDVLIKAHSSGAWSTLGSVSTDIFYWDMTELNTLSIGRVFIKDSYTYRIYIGGIELFKLDGDSLATFENATKAFTDNNARLLIQNEGDSGSLFFLDAIKYFIPSSTINNWAQGATTIYAEYGKASCEKEEIICLKSLATAKTTTERIAVDGFEMNLNLYIDGIKNSTLYINLTDDEKWYSEGSSIGFAIRYNDANNADVSVSYTNKKDGENIENQVGTMQKVAFNWDGADNKLNIQLVEGKWQMLVNGVALDNDNCLDYNEKLSANIKYFSDGAYINLFNQGNSIFTLGMQNMQWLEINTAPYIGKLLDSETRYSLKDGVYLDLTQIFCDDNTKDVLTFSVYGGGEIIDNKFYSYKPLENGVKTVFLLCTDAKGLQKVYKLDLQFGGLASNFSPLVITLIIVGSLIAICGITIGIIFIIKFSKRRKKAQ